MLKYEFQTIYAKSPLFKLIKHLVCTVYGQECTRNASNAFSLYDKQNHALTQKLLPMGS